MCTPAQVISNALTAAAKATDIYQERKNTKYQAQIAINNAKNLELQALNEKQQGIEQSRLDKMEGLKELNRQKAKNAASGFDLNSDTSIYQYEDIKNNAEINALNTLNSYNSTANNYQTRAKSYISSAKSKISAYNNSLFSKGLYGLGELTNVSDEWAEPEQKENFL